MFYRGESTIVTQYQMDGVGHFFPITPNKFSTMLRPTPLYYLTSPLTSCLMFGEIYSTVLFIKKNYLHILRSKAILLSLLLFFITMYWLLGCQMSRGKHLFNHRLASSVDRAPNYRAGGREFGPKTEPTLRFLK